MKVARKSAGIAPLSVVSARKNSWRYFAHLAVEVQCASSIDNAEASENLSCNLSNCKRLLETRFYKANTELRPTIQSTYFAKMNTVYQARKWLEIYSAHTEEIFD